MRKLLAACATLAFASAATAPANAAILFGEVTGGTSGGVFELLDTSTGFTVGVDNFNSPNAFGFNERTNVVLPFSVGGIAAGTRVNSHFLFFDPLDIEIITGNVFFDQNILGIVYTSDEMDATDSLFGLSNITYLQHPMRGFEPGDIAPFDFATFSGNALAFSSRASTPGDYIRVLTAVPEPATWAMMLLGFLAVGGMVRSRRSQEVKVSYS